jgi:hypothetical protein
VLALDALLELVVHVERHLGIGVADLGHDPLEVEFAGEELNRDIGTSEAVRGDVL